MSCVKNLGERDYRKWICAGCPLPSMMGIERRAGKDKPVLTKALTRLDGNMFKAYAAVREKWSIYDCYHSTGPIQFEGPSSDMGCYLVTPPDVDTLVKETYDHVNFEKSQPVKTLFHRDINHLSELSRFRVEQMTVIPKTLENGNY